MFGAQNTRGLRVNTTAQVPSSGELSWHRDADLSVQVSGLKTPTQRSFPSWRKKSLNSRSCKTWHVHPCQIQWSCVMNLKPEMPLRIRPAKTRQLQGESSDNCEPGELGEFTQVGSSSAEAEPVGTQKTSGFMLISRTTHCKVSQCTWASGSQGLAFSEFFSWISSWQGSRGGLGARRRKGGEGSFHWLNIRVHVQTAGVLSGSF